MNIKYGTEEATKQILKEGDKLFKVRNSSEIEEIEVMSVTVDSAWCKYRDDYGRVFYNPDINRTYFYTLEEATTVVETKKKIAEKRSLLKKYEKELNEKLGIRNNFIVK